MKSKQAIPLLFALGAILTVVSLWRPGSSTKPPAPAAPGLAQQPTPSAPAPQGAAASAPASLAPVATSALTPVPTDVRTVPFADFARWLGELQALRAQGAPVPAPVVEAGRQFAEARRPLLAQMLREQPAEALARSLKWHEWAALPAEVQALVEKPFSQSADLNVTPDCRPLAERQGTWQEYRVAMEGADYDAFSYGRREQATTKLGTPLQGFSLDQAVALWESPAYRLSGEELVAAQALFPDGNPRGKSWLTGADLGAAPVAALIGGRVHYFANEEEVATVTQTISLAEQQRSPHSVSGLIAAGIGGTFDTVAFTRGAFQAASVWTETPKRVLAIRLAYTDVAASYPTTPQLVTDLNNTSNALRQASFQKTWIVPTITTIVTLPNNKAFYEANSNEKLADDARAGAAAAGYPSANYDMFVYCFPTLARIGGTPAFANINGPNQWVNGNQRPTVFVHEFGHNYGLGHANSWKPYLGGFNEHRHPFGDSLEHQEYGDPFDLMATDFLVLGNGQAIFPGGHFAMRGKALLNWIEPTEVHDATTNGVYRLRRFDHVDARIAAGGKLALKVRNSKGDEFWIGYRRNFTTTVGGAYVIWANEPDRHRFLDMTPLSQGANYGADKEDGVLPPHRTYVDPSGSLRITTLGQGGTSPNEYLDVEVAVQSTAPSYQLFTTADRSTNGLLGSYVNSSLRGRLAQEDWRSTAGVVISGRRVDASVEFPGNGWGARAPVGVTGGSDADWENFSVQWDGFLQVNQSVQLATISDDGSRMWIDVNGDNTFAASAPEFANNNWGTGQGATIGQYSVALAPGLYRVRLQYEEGNGGNSFGLVTPAARAFDIYADAAGVTNGLIGSYVNTSLRAIPTQNDWRTSQTIVGTRIDPSINWLTNGWGVRPGVTGGTDADWENYSVQWDGFVRVFTPTRFATISDDGSRMWIDVNGDNSFAAAAPEFVNNNWGLGQGDTLGTVSDLVAPGLYRFRIQYEEGGVGNHFLLTGTTGELPGTAGYALCFDGVDDFVEIPNAGQSLPTDEITIEFWERAYEYRQQSTFSVSPDNTLNRISSHVPWVDGHVYWDFGNINVGGRLSYGASAEVIGRWQHWAFVSSRAGNFQRIYRNGVQEAADATAESFVRYAASFLIGNNSAGTVFKGELDEFRIWSIARSQGEIQAGMNCRLGLPQSNLWGYWRFDTNSGTTLTDLSGNGRHGNLINGPTWVVSSAPVVAPAGGAPATTIVTTVADSGPGSLRQALLNAGACEGADVITFAPGLSGQVIRLTSAQLNIADQTGPVLITATNLPAGIAISGEGARRVFHIAAGSTVTLDSLTVSNGLGTAGFLPDNGGGGALCRGNLILNRCTFVRNAVPSLAANISVGGAVAVYQGTLTATNSTFALNSIQAAATAFGGAIVGNASTLVFRHCTIVSNTATGTSGGNGGGILSDGGTVQLHHTIIAANIGSLAADLSGIGGATLTSQGYNLLGNGTGAPSFVHGVNGDQVGTGGSPILPLLGPLQNNGGRTLTLRPVPGSPIIDAGNPSSAGAPDQDQRGLARVSGGRLDVGAVEAVALVANAPASLVRCAGGSASFSTTVTSGEGPFAYQWAKDGVLIAGATGTSYTRPSLTVADAGDYCVTITSATHRLTRCAILSVPTVTLTPLTNTLACTGETVRFEAGLLAGGSTLVFTNDFNGALPTGLTFSGSAAMNGGFLKLTTAVNGQNGRVVLDDFTSGRPITEFTATFKASLFGGTTPPADGFSFNLSPAPASAFNVGAEDGVITGLAINFDTYDNAGDGPSVEVRWNSVVIGTRFFQSSQSPAVTDPLVAQRDVRIQLHPNGTIDVRYGTNVLFDHLPTPYVPITGGQWVLGGRNGGLNDNHWIDDLSIAVPPPFGSPVTYRWVKNGTALPGQTNESLVLASVVETNAGTYSVVVASSCNTATNTASLSVATLAPIVSTLNDSGPGSLRQAILNINECGGSGVITFSVTGVIRVTNTLPAITANVIITGPGTNLLTISGRNAVELFTLNSGTTNRISGLTLANGFSSNPGAAIRNLGVLTLGSCVLVSNRTVNSFGGAVCNWNGASFTATNCVFAANTIPFHDGKLRQTFDECGAAGGWFGFLLQGFDARGHDKSGGSRTHMHPHAVDQIKPEVFSFQIQGNHA